MGRGVDFPAERVRMVDRLVRSGYLKDVAGLGAPLSGPPPALVPPADRAPAPPRAPPPPRHPPGPAPPSSPPPACLGPGLFLPRAAGPSSGPRAVWGARWGPGGGPLALLCPSGGRRPGGPSSPAGRGVTPGLVGQAIVQRFRRARFLGREDAVDVPLVQRPVEDPPVPAVQKGNRLPERLEQAGVVEAVEQFPVLRLNRVVDDLGPESEVAHDRAGLGQGLGTRAAQALFDGA